RISGQQVWARQLNLEDTVSPMLRNDGGRVWLLGVKTERASTVMETANSGRTELLGGLLYPANAVSPDTAAFVNNGSWQSLTYAVSAYVQGGNYRLQLLSTRGNSTQALLQSDLIKRGSLGSIVTLLTDYP